MIKKTFLCALTLILTLSLFAQEKSTQPTLSQQTENPARLDAEQRAERMTTVLTSKLELNQEQVSQMSNIQLDAQLKYDEIKVLKSTDKELFIKKQTNLIKDIDARILLILNEDQSTAYNELANRERRKQAVDNQLRSKTNNSN